MKFLSKNLNYWVVSALMAAPAIFFSPAHAKGDDNTDCICACGPETCSIEFCGPSSDKTCGNSMCYTGPWSHGEWQVEMINLINDERHDEETRPVGCNFIALDHAQEFADFLCEHSCHDSTNPHNCAGQTIYDRMDAALADGLSWTTMGENLHDAPYLDPMLAMYGGIHGNIDITGFMESPGHRANILDPSFSQVAVAYTVCEGDGMTYWVQWFGE